MAPIPTGHAPVLVTPPRSSSPAPAAARGSPRRSRVRCCRVTILPALPAPRWARRWRAHPAADRWHPEPRRVQHQPRSRGRNQSAGGRADRSAARALGPALRLGVGEGRGQHQGRPRAGPLALRRNHRPRFGGLRLGCGRGGARRCIRRRRRQACMSPRWPLARHRRSRRRRLRAVAAAAQTRTGLSGRRNPRACRPYGALDWRPFADRPTSPSGSPPATFSTTPCAAMPASSRTSPRTPGAKSGCGRGSFSEGPCGAAQHSRSDRL